MTELDVLIAARADVKRGWCKFYLFNPATGNVCADGAVCRAADGDFTGAGSSLSPDARKTVKAVRRILQAALGPGQILTAFNDHPSTTKADVLALFDRAIAAEAVKVSSDPAHTYTTAA